MSNPKQLIDICYDELVIEDLSADPIYLPKRSLIIDRFTKSKLFQIPFNSCYPYYWFDITFRSYNYDQIYNPKLRVYQKKVVSKIYAVILWINLPKVLTNTEIPDHIAKNLQIIFSILSIRNIQKSKSYEIASQNLSSFLQERTRSRIKLLPWHNVLLKSDNKYAFNLVKKGVNNLSQIKKTRFRCLGSLIETNNVHMIKDKLAVDKRTLIILPSRLKYYWKRSKAIILTLDQIITNMTNEEYKFKIIDKDINQIIIQESYTEFFNIYKMIIDLVFENVSKPRVWIINSLPLCCYFNNYDNKLCINDISSLINIWARYSNCQKKKFKIDIIKMIVNNFNQIYAKVDYDSLQILSSLTVIKIKLSEFETKIWTSIHTYYDNWIKSLTNDPNNKYSMTTDSNANKIMAKMHNAIMILLCAVVEKQYVAKFFEEQINRTRQHSVIAEELIDKEIQQYLSINKHTYLKFGERGVVDMEGAINGLKNKMSIVENIRKNYERYDNGTVYDLYLDSELSGFCPICYSSNDEDPDMIWTQFICGHGVCLDCMVGTIKNFNSCPICKELIDCKKIVFIRESIPSYRSNWLEYLRSLSETTLILSDMEIFDNRMSQLTKARVINYKKFGFSNRIKTIVSLDKIVLFSIPLEIQSKKDIFTISCIINYFQTLNNKVTIHRIVLETV